MKKLIFLSAFVLVSAALFSLAADFASLYQLADNPFLTEALYSHPERLASKIDPSGAVGVNSEYQRGKGDKWFIEEQRYGADLVEAGIVRKDKALQEEGWKILKWGFDRQSDDGSFFKTGDPFHSTSLFVEAAARALTVEKDSGGEAFGIHKAEFLPKLLASARWFLKSGVYANGNKNNQPYTHRRYLLAAALGEVASLTGDEESALAAEKYARDGLALMTVDGVNPEKGGADVNYQALGILFAERFFASTQNGPLKTEIKRMIQRGLQWELQNVDAAGNISAAQSTRTGKETSRAGKVKSVDYKDILKSFAYGSTITGDQSFSNVAWRIAAGRKWVSSSGEAISGEANPGAANPGPGAVSPNGASPAPAGASPSP